MAAQIIDGKALAKEVRERVQADAARLAARGIVPRLEVLLVGDDPASASYVRGKETAARKAGIAGGTTRLPAEISEVALIEHVERLNRDPAVDGILVQLPLPAHIDAAAVIRAVDPLKDVDGFHPLNVGRPGHVPCTPRGILLLLERAGFDPRGREAVVVGRSDIVGKPTALLLLHRHATVTICHSRTRDLGEVVRRAEIVVAAVGKPGLIRGDWIREGAAVIDVGMNRSAEGTLVGDVEFEGARARAAAITPVPGGVGPMTIACLLENTVRAAVARRSPAP